MAASATKRAPGFDTQPRTCTFPLKHRRALHRSRAYEVLSSTSSSSIPPRIISSGTTLAIDSTRRNTKVLLSNREERSLCHLFRSTLEMSRGDITRSSLLVAKEAFDPEVGEIHEGLTSLFPRGFAFPYRFSHKSLEKEVTVLLSRYTEPEALRKGIESINLARRCTAEDIANILHLASLIETPGLNLDLRYCPIHLVPSINFPKALTHLQISNVAEPYLSGILNACPHLHSLDVSGGLELVSIDSLRHSRLQKLPLQDSSALKSVSDFSKFPNLRAFRIDECHDLRGLRVIRAPLLEKLTLARIYCCMDTPQLFCANLEEVNFHDVAISSAVDFSNCTRLKKFKFSHCYGLMHAPNVTKCLEFEKGTFSHCTILMDLPVITDRHHHFQSIDVYECGRLNDFHAASLVKVCEESK